VTANKSSVLQVGFIGCGRIADLHVPGYREDIGAKIYAVCDANAETAERRKNEWGAEKAYTDYRELLADPAVDAVEVLTPQFLHEEQAVAALRAKKHVALQKPMTTDLKSADRVIAAAEASGRVFKVSETYPFYPPIARAKELIEQGAIGEPQAIRIHFVGGGRGGWAVPADAWKWRMKEAQEGRGMNTFDHGHHLWATAWFLLGPPERVSAYIDSLDGIVDSPATVMWKARGGVRYGICDFAHGPDLEVPSKYYSNDEWVEVSGSKGILFINRCTGNVRGGPPLSLYDGTKMVHFDEVPSDWGLGFVRATANFVRATRGEEAPMLDGRQAREVLRFALAVQKSARIRHEVYVDDMETVLPRVYFAHKVREAVGAVEGAVRSVLAKWFADERVLAARAAELTEALPRRFDPLANPGWQARVGLALPDANLHYVVSISDGRVEVVRSEIPADVQLLLEIPAGTWAAILLKRKRIEAALVQGKLKFRGDAREGLRLRKAFGF
jgi:predicted dehydrogenase